MFIPNRFTIKGSLFDTDKCTAIRMTHDKFIVVWDNGGGYNCIEYSLEEMQESLQTGLWHIGERD